MATRPFLALLVLSLGAFRVNAQPPQPDPKFAALASQLVLAPDAAARDTILNGNPTLLTHDLVMAVDHIAAGYFDKRDADQAGRISGILCDLAERIHDAAGLANCSYAQGALLDLQRRSNEAIAKYEEALTRFQGVGDHASQSRTLNKIAVIHSIRNEYAEAAPLYERAMAEANLSGERERVAQTSMNLGLILRGEMMSLDLRAGLVVLSGCETGRGGMGNGEGLIGMSWALFVAGSQTTVSQCKVDGASTTEIMLAFHGNLRKDPAKARALQQAALKVMRKPEYRHPFYWSGFVMMGQGF